ncbi:MAG TPA: hypothetical protein VMW65_03155 [Chloroflexota bacterium]|nr:hypothetical protein [Chloroflexota bacterium]
MISTSEGGLPTASRGNPWLDQAILGSDLAVPAWSERVREFGRSLVRFVGFHGLAIATSGLLLIMAKLGNSEEIQIFD